MDPVGMTNACTSVVVPNRSRMMVTVHSAITPRGMSLLRGFLVCSGASSASPVFSSLTVRPLYRKAQLRLAESLATKSRRRLLRLCYPVDRDAGDYGSDLSPAAKPGAVYRAGALLHHTRGCRADVNEDRTEPSEPTRTHGIRHQFADVRWLLFVRFEHRAHGLRAARRRALDSVPDYCPDLCLGHHSLGTFFPRNSQSIQADRHRDRGDGGRGDGPGW